MAVDSRDKRASVLGFGLASLLVLPAPGTIDQGDRQQVSYSYRGISAQFAVNVEFMRVEFTARQSSVTCAGRAAVAGFTGRQASTTMAGRSARVDAQGRSGSVTFNPAGD